MCGKRCTLEPKPCAYLENLRQRAVALYSDGLSFRRIARQLGVNHQTVTNWINVYIACLPTRTLVQVLAKGKVQAWHILERNEMLTLEITGGSVVALSGLREFTTERSLSTYTLTTR